MAKPIVHIYQPVDQTGKSHERLEAAGARLIMPSGTWDLMANSRVSEEAVLDPGTSVAAGVANRSIQITGASMDGAPDLRLVAKYTVGYDNVDVDAATERGILVVHSPTEGNWGGVAEGTMAYMLSLLKKVREKDRHVKNGGWRDPALFGTYVGARMIDGYEGLTIGIVGLGRIGSRLADLLAPWRVKLIAYDPYAEDSKFVHHNVRPVGLETLLKESDVVTLHCDLNKETTNLIGEKQLALMKPSAILVNAARGPIVDVDALFDALDGDRIAGAALDVLPEEPPEPQLALLGLGDKVLLSPHMITANGGTGLSLAVPWVEAAILAALRGDVPKYVVNEDALPKWQSRFGGQSLI